MKISCVLGAAAGLMLVAGTANADVVETFGFRRITSNSSSNIASQLQMEVSAASAAATSVTFTFANLVGVASNATEIYFDDGTLLGISSVANSTSGATTPAFFNNAGNPNPTNLPGGNTLTPAFQTTQGFWADTPGGNTNGLNEAGDRVAITFDLINGKTWADTIASLRQLPGNDWLRVGLHVRSIGTDGNSDGFVNIVPLPPAAWAGLASLAGVLGVGYIRRRSFRA